MDMITRTIGYVPDSNDQFSVGKIERHCRRHKLELYKIYHDKEELFSELRNQSLVILTNIRHLGVDQYDMIVTKQKLLEDYHCHLYVRNKQCPLDSRVHKSKPMFDLLVNMSILLQNYQDAYVSSDEETE